MKLWRKSKEPKVTLADLPRLRAEVAREIAAQDALDDEYMALKDRPVVMEWLRVTECSEPFLSACVDFSHYDKWMKDRRHGNG